MILNSPCLLVNLISQEHFVEFSLDLAQTCTLTQGPTGQNLEVMGERSRSLWAHVCVSANMNQMQIEAIDN